MMILTFLKWCQYCFSCLRCRNKMSCPDSILGVLHKSLQELVAFFPNPAIKGVMWITYVFFLHWQFLNDFQNHSDFSSKFLSSGRPMWYVQTIPPHALQIWDLWPQRTHSNHWAVLSWTHPLFGGETSDSSSEMIFEVLILFVSDSPTSVDWIPWTVELPPGIRGVCKIKSKTRGLGFQKFTQIQLPIEIIYCATSIKQSTKSSYSKQ